MTTYTISPQEAGQRLDAALTHLLPGWGLRARRRVCENGLVLVNGKMRDSGYKVKSGDTLQTQPGLPENFPTHQAGQQKMPAQRAPAHVSAVPHLVPHMAPHVVHVQPPFAALFKPAGLHSAHIIGSKQASLESALPALLPQYPQARLLNRLDNETSGLVMACLEQGKDGERIWKMYSDNGEIRKTYLLIAQSETDLAPIFTDIVYARAALDTQNRAITRVLPHSAPSPLRHTRFTLVRQLTQTEAQNALTHALAATGSLPEEFKLPTPALDALNQEIPPLVPAVPFPTEQASLSGVLPSMPPFLYLIQAEILLGARHQIRAHAASQGFPLWGDTLYGASPLPIHSFFLHHVKLEMPGFFAEYPAPWNLD